MTLLHDGHLKYLLTLDRTKADRKASAAVDVRAVTCFITKEFTLRLATTSLANKYYVLPY